MVSHCVPLTPSSSFERLASKISLQNLSEIKCVGHQNKGKDYHFKRLLISKQILLVSTIVYEELRGM